MFILQLETLNFRTQYCNLFKNTHAHSYVTIVSVFVCVLLIRLIWLYVQLLEIVVTEVMVTNSD